MESCLPQSKSPLLALVLDSPAAFVSFCQLLLEQGLGTTKGVSAVSRTRSGVSI